MNRFNPFVCLLITMLWGTSCSRVQHLAVAESSNLEISEHLYPAKDSAMLLFVEPFRLQMEARMNQVIGHSEAELIRMQPDGALNRIVADIVHDYAQSSLGGKIDFAVQNYFGLRINSLPQGSLTLGLLYELMPFENYLVILEVPGSVVAELCDLIAENNGWPVSYGLSFAIRDGKAHSIMVAGETLDKEKTYRIATNDYLANGGDNALFFREFQQISTGLLIRDAMIDYIRTLELRGEYLRDKNPGNRIYLDAP